MKHIARFITFLFLFVFIAILAPKSVSAVAPIVAFSNLPQVNDTYYSTLGSNDYSLGLAFTTDAQARNLYDITLRVSYEYSPPITGPFTIAAMPPACSLDLSLYTFSPITQKGTLITPIGSTNVSSTSPIDAIVTPTITITLAANTTYWLDISKSGTDCRINWHGSSVSPTAPSGIYTDVKYYYLDGLDWLVDTSPQGIKMQVVDAPVVVEPPVEPPVEEVITPVEEVKTPDTTALGCTLTNDVSVAGATDNTYCRLLMKNGAVIKFPGAVPQSLINLGVILAVDVYRMQGGQSLTDFGGYSQICLAGEGRLFYLDARTSPRVQTELASDIVDGMTCGWIPAVGTLVLTN